MSKSEGGGTLASECFNSVAGLVGRPLMEAETNFKYSNALKHWLIKSLTLYLNEGYTLNRCKCTVRTLGFKLLSFLELWL